MASYRLALQSSMIPRVTRDAPAASKIVSQSAVMNSNNTRTYVLTISPVRVRRFAAHGHKIRPYDTDRGSPTTDRIAQLQQPCSPVLRSSDRTITPSSDARWRRRRRRQRRATARRLQRLVDERLLVLLFAMVFVSCVSLLIQVEPGWKGAVLPRAQPLTMARTRRTPGAQLATASISYLPDVAASAQSTQS